MKTLLILLIAPFVFTHSTADHRAWIATEQQGDLLTIRGKFANEGLRAESFRYELTTTKQGQSGRSSSTQAGRFEAPAQAEISLSNMSINITKEDTYAIELKIFREDTVYLEDKIEYQG